MTASWINPGGGINGYKLHIDLLMSANPGDVLSVTTVQIDYEISEMEASRALEVAAMMNMAICINQNAQGKQTNFRIYET